MDISVVIATYNRAWLLPKLLDAWREVACVTGHRYELIFSDDGSTDNTIDILNEHSNDLPLVILENEHGGAARARNSAIQRAQGERILMLGDDIFPDPQLINRHFELSQQVGPQTAILGDIKWHPELKLNYLMTHITEVGHEQFSLNAFRAGQYVDFRHFYTSNISVDRSLLLSEPVVFDERFSKVNFEDVELGHRLALKGLRIQFHPEAVGYHHHAYTIEGFCNRQRTAGEMAVVLVELHPELEDTFGIERIRAGYEMFIKSRSAGFPVLKGERFDLDTVIQTCKAYEEILTRATSNNHYIKLSLSSLYLRLFRAAFELAVLSASDANAEKYWDYLSSVYFNSDGYWNLYLEATNAFKDMSDADRSLRETIFLSYADQPPAGMQIALANKEVELLRTKEQKDQAERELAETRQELEQLKASYAWRLGNRVVQPAKTVRGFTKRLTSRSPDRAPATTRDTAEALLDTAPSTETKANTVRVGIVMTEASRPSKEARAEFFSAVGDKHCFVVQQGSDRFRVISKDTSIESSYDLLPVDYFYRPEDWSRRLSNDQFKNSLLSLAHVKLDFVIVSPSLAQLPQVASWGLRNQVIFSKKLGLDFLERNDGQAKGRVLRLLPANHAVTEVTIEELFPNRTVKYARDEGRYAPDQGYVFLNRDAKPASDATASEICIRHFIPKFKKEKKLIFVLPMVMAVGGVERNAIEVMRQLKDRYQFVVVTMDRHDLSRGSLHHQLKGLTEAVYDLMELGNLHYYLAFLNDLKNAYEPDAVWICNGMLWLCDHAEPVRRIFHDMPIIDNQAWDAKFGWSEFYHLPGIQSFDRFIATNSKVYRKFVDELKMNPAQIDSIYPCFDANRFAGPSTSDEQEAFRKKFDLPVDRPIFLFCGRLHEQKGPLDFLELARRRLRRQDDAFFVMRGTGDLAPEVDKFIRDHNLTNLRRISYVEDTVPLLSIASGLIITSHYETITIVLLEALAMGLPVLSTDVGDIRLVLEQCQAGVVVPEIGDADAMEAAYENWRKHLARYSTNARNCSADIRARFSSEAIAKQYCISWERAMDEFQEKSVE